MAKKKTLSEEEQKKRRKESQDNYRLSIHRFTLQFSLKDKEAYEWLSRQEDRDAYIKNSILADKMRQSEKQVLTCAERDNSV